MFHLFLWFVCFLFYKADPKDLKKGFKHVNTSPRGYKCSIYGLRGEILWGAFHRPLRSEHGAANDVTFEFKMNGRVRCCR